MVQLVQASDLIMDSSLNGKIITTVVIGQDYVHPVASVLKLPSVRRNAGGSERMYADVKGKTKSRGIESKVTTIVRPLNSSRFNIQLRM